MNWPDKLMELFGCIIEIFLLFDYFNNFFEIKIRDEKVKIVFIGSCGLFFMVNTLDNCVISLLFVPMLLWLFVNTVFDGELGIKVRYFIMAYLIMLGVEFLYIVLNGIKLNILFKTGIAPIAKYGWQRIFVKFLYFIPFLIIKQISSKSKKHMTNNLFAAYLGVPLSIIGIMIILFYSGIDFKEQMGLRIILILFFMFMVIENILLFYVFEKHAENLSENAAQQMELVYKNAEIEQLTKIAEINESYNEVVHNMAHFHKLIEQLARENENKEICEIMKKINGVLNEREAYEYSCSKILNAILSEYSVKSKKVGIEFDVYVEPGSILNQIENIDLVTMMGNILENAVTAASKKGEDARVAIRIYMSRNGRQCVVKVVNDYLEKLKVKDGKLETTKKEKGIHGIGMRSILRTVEKYGGAFEYYVEDRKFYAILVVPV